MPVNSDGYCSSCHQWALEHPSLECPYCHDARTDQLVRDLELSPDDNAERVLIACKAELAHLYKRRQAAIALRAAAARAILAGPTEDFTHRAEEAHVRVSSLEKWANPPEKPPRERKTRKILTPEQKAARKDKARLKAEWAKHEQRLAERTRLLEEHADDLPARLRPPLAPPSP